MTKNQLAYALIISLISSVFTLLAYDWYKDKMAIAPYSSIELRQRELFKTNTKKGLQANDVAADFAKTSEKVKYSVVYVRTVLNKGNSLLKKYHPNVPEFEEYLDDRFGDGYYPKETAGSGVILTDDGYIATNYHVIEQAKKVEVILYNKRKYEAKIIGTDPSTDLALLKINANNLPAIPYGSSDNVQVGEWVLAIGNPFDLTSTVTAGIVSAKARSINILKEKENTAVESFIQTDAAVNPGNSGGALVNIHGELIGINTAIASTTGAFAGYSFAVPVDLVKKVMDDLLQYGEVQRAMLGVAINDITAELVEEKKLTDFNGVYVQAVNKNSAAEQAKLRQGDVITHINNKPVNSVAELQEIVARYRPGNKIQVTYMRNGKPTTSTVMLKSKAGEVAVVKPDMPKAEFFDELGAELTSLSQKEKEALNLKSGLRVTDITKKGKLYEAGVREGIIITHIDKKPMQTTADVANSLKKIKGGVLIEGYDESIGEVVYFALAL